MLVIAAVLATLPAPPPSPARSPRVKIDGVERAMARMINAVRRSHGLGPFRLDSRMSLGAGRHSRRMALTSSLSHTSTRRLPLYARAQTVGEVIGWLQGRRPPGQGGVMIRLWLRSPSHRPLLLSPRFSRMGIGRDATTGSTFFTVAFAAG